MYIRGHRVLDNRNDSIGDQSAEHCKGDVEIYLGMKLDGHHDYEDLKESLPRYSELTTYANPTIQTLSQTIVFKTWGSKKDTHINIPVGYITA